MSSTKTKTETYTLVSPTQRWNGRTAVVFTVEGDVVRVQYYPNGTSGIPDLYFEVILEGIPGQRNIHKDEPLTRDIGVKVWNRFLELGFKRV